MGQIIMLVRSQIDATFLIQVERNEKALITG